MDIWTGIALFVTIDLVLACSVIVFGTWQAELDRTKTGCAMEIRRRGFKVNGTHKDRYWPPPKPYRDPGVQRASRLKGETQAQMDHAENVMARGDTSIDHPWEWNRNYDCRDYYTVFIAALFLLPKLLLFPVLWLLLFIPLALNNCYVHSLPERLHALPRTGCLWYTHLVVQWIVSLPAQILCLALLIYDLTVFTVFGMLYTLCTCQIKTYCENLNYVRPYWGGPCLYTHFADIVVASGGELYRQGLCEHSRSFTVMFMINPWIKYWLCGNIYLGPVGERYVTQISQDMQDMPVADVETWAMNCISKAKHGKKNQHELDQMFFVPHYPYPPLDRQYAIGMQHTSTLTTFVHTTHFESPQVDGPVKTFSNSAELPVYRVMLWRNNPYHLYTGFVEANITTGLPSQPDKKHGGEHPMWLVSGRNRLASDRNFNMSNGWIDNYFDRFLPVFCYYIRRNIRGKKIAEDFLAKDPRKGFEVLRKMQARDAKKRAKGKTVYTDDERAKGEDHDERRQLTSPMPGAPFQPNVAPMPQFRAPAPMASPQFRQPAPHYNQAGSQVPMLAMNMPPTNVAFNSGPQQYNWQPHGSPVYRVD